MVRRFIVSTHPTADPMSEIDVAKWAVYCELPDKEKEAVARFCRDAQPGQFHYIRGRKLSCVQIEKGVQYPRVYHRGKWIAVVEPQAPMAATHRFEIRAKKGDELIGWIQWYSPFRCYSLLPREQTVWETDCLGDIVAVLNSLNCEHKAKMKARLSGKTEGGSAHA